MTAAPKRSAMTRAVRSGTSSALHVPCRRRAAGERARTLRLETKSGAASGSCSPARILVIGLLPLPDAELRQLRDDFLAGTGRFHDLLNRENLAVGADIEGP